MFLNGNLGVEERLTAYLSTKCVLFLSHYFKVLLKHGMQKIMKHMYMETGQTSNDTGLLPFLAV